jgi:hypothetical protein
LWAAFGFRVARLRGLGSALGLVAFGSGSAFGLGALGAGVAETGRPRASSSDSALALAPV